MDNILRKIFTLHDLNAIDEKGIRQSFVNLNEKHQGLCIDSKGDVILFGGLKVIYPSLYDYIYKINISNINSFNINPWDIFRKEVNNQMKKFSIYENQILFKLLNNAIEKNKSYFIIKGIIDNNDIQMAKEFLKLEPNVAIVHPSNSANVFLNNNLNSDFRLLNHLEFIFNYECPKDIIYFINSEDFGVIAFDKDIYSQILTNDDENLTVITKCRLTYIMKNIESVVVGKISNDKK